jgi:hypothetical protein
VGSQSLSGRVKRYSVVGPRGQTGLRPCVGSSSSLGTLRAVRECLRPRCQTELRPCVQSLTPEGEDVATSEAGVRFSERSRRSAGCRSSRPTWLRPGVRSGSFSHGVERKRALWVLAPSTMGVPLSTFCEATRTPAPRSASLAAGATTQRPTPPGPQRTFPLHAVRERSANPRMSEALVGRQDLHPHAPLAPSENDRGRTHGRSPVGCDDLHAHVPLATFRERSRAHAWAKPCLAGRPTALVRTQPPETNTSRGRPTGMELPDYPVVVLTPHRRTRMGPHLRFPPGLFPDSQLVMLPAGSFPGFAARYASRRVFPRIRSSLRFPPVLFFQSTRLKGANVPSFSMMLSLMAPLSSTA